MNMTLTKALVILALGAVVTVDTEAQRRRLPRGRPSTTTTTTTTTGGNESANELYEAFCGTDPTTPVPDDSEMSNVDTRECVSLRSQASINANDDTSTTPNPHWVYNGTADAARLTSPAVNLTTARTVVSDNGDQVMVLDPALTIDPGDSIVCDYGGSYEVIRVLFWTDAGGQSTTSSLTRGYDSSTVSDHDGDTCYLTSNTPPSQIKTVLSEGEMAMDYVHVFVHYEQYGPSWKSVNSTGGNLTDTKQWHFSRSEDGGLTFEPHFHLDGLDNDGSGTASCFSPSTHVATLGLRFYGFDDFEAMDPVFTNYADGYRLGPNATGSSDEQVRPRTNYCVPAGRWIKYVDVFENVTSDWNRYWLYAQADNEASYTVVYNGVQFGWPEPAADGRPDWWWIVEGDVSGDAYQPSPGRQTRDMIQCARNAFHVRSSGNITTSGLTLATIVSKFLAAAPAAGACE